MEKVRGTCFTKILNEDIVYSANERRKVPKYADEEIERKQYV